MNPDSVGRDQDAAAAPQWKIRRRRFWKRRKFVVVVLAVLFAVAATLWLVSKITNFKPPDEE